MHYGQIEGTDLVVLDPRFKKCFTGYIRVERLWTGAIWSEGPVWFPAARQLVWSDIPNNRMMRYADGGGVSVFRERSNHSNGNSIDNQGRLVTCEHLTRRVTLLYPELLHCCSLRWVQDARRALETWASRTDAPPVIVLEWDASTGRLSRRPGSTCSGRTARWTRRSCTSS